MNPGDPTFWGRLEEKEQWKRTRTENRGAGVMRAGEACQGGVLPKPPGDRIKACFTSGKTEVTGDSGTPFQSVLRQKLQSGRLEGKWVNRMWGSEDYVYTTCSWNRIGVEAGLWNQVRLLLSFVRWEILEQVYKWLGMFQWGEESLCWCDTS